MHPGDGVHDVSKVNIHFNRIALLVCRAQVLWRIIGLTIGLIEGDNGSVCLAQAL